MCCPSSSSSRCTTWRRPENTDTSNNGKPHFLALMEQTLLGVFYCPTRRPPLLSPNYSTCGNAANIPVAARTDYACNAGDGGWDAGFTWNISGPGSPWDPLAWTGPGQRPPNTSMENGVIFGTSQIKMADITDGASNTFLLGEKLLDPDHYADGLEGTDNNPLFGGPDWDWSRWCMISTDPSTGSLPTIRRGKIGRETTIITPSAAPTPPA